MSVEVGVTWASAVLTAFVTMTTGGGVFAAAADDTFGSDALENCLRDALPPYEIEWMLRPVPSPLIITWNVTSDEQLLSDGSTCNSSLSCYPFDLFIKELSDSAMPTQLRPTQIQRGQGIRFPILRVSGNGTVRLQLVDQTGFLECDGSRGRLLPLSPDGSSSRVKMVDAVSSSQLKMGVNYLIAVNVATSNRSSSFFCESGLRINVTVKDSSDCQRLSNETCFKRGRCVANFTSSTFYCRCCPGFECLRQNKDDFSTNKTIGVWSNYKMQSNNRMMKSNGYKRKSAESSSAACASVVLDRSRCNGTTTCPTQNDTTCVVQDNELNDPCTNANSATDCTTAQGKTKTEVEHAVDGDGEEGMDICDPNPCLNGICIVDSKQRNSFRCYCVPGFGGRLCDLIYSSPCSPNPCRNDGVCRLTNQVLEGEGGGEGSGQEGEGRGGGGTKDGGGSEKPRAFECLCRRGYVKDDCSYKATVCQSNPCLHVCFDHGDYYVCECNPGFTGENCDVFINTCESNPCQNGGTCNSNPYGHSCHCPFGYHGNHCEEHAIPDFLVPPQHPPQLHSLQMVGFTLTGAVAIAMAVVVCCYCNIGRFCDTLVCPPTTTPMTKYEKQLDHYRRRSSISHFDRKRRRNQSLDGDSATTNAFTDDDVETTSLQDRLFVEVDDNEDVTSEDVRDHDRRSFWSASGPHKSGRSMSRLHLFDV